MLAGLGREQGQELEVEIQHKGKTAISKLL